MKKYIKKERPKLSDKICKTFGCNRRLMDFEILFSDYCTSCNNKIKTKNYES